MKRQGHRGFYFALVCALAATFSLRAGEPGDEVVVIYNSKMPESRDVATHYASVRHVPAKQLLALNLPTGENMTRAEYDDELQQPLLKFLEKEKLLAFDSGSSAAPPKVRAAKIRYAVLCFGVPLRILSDAKLVEPGDDKVAPALQGRNGAAVDSELTLLPAIHQKLKLTGPLSNPCFGITNATVLNPTNGILIVARLDGPTAAIARALVDKAVEAETNGLWGRAYFDLRGLTNGDYKTGDDWIRGAAEAARVYGFETVVDEKPETFSAGFPMSQIALYAGWYDGDASGPFARPTVEFMPGAFAYHLHSFSAHSLRTTNQNWCGPFLAKGVTATMGCIDEPYLDGTPNMQVFFGRWLFLGFTFGEAACAAQRVVSWQTTAVGDPLFRPFAKNPQTFHAELIARHSPLVEWSHLLWVNRNLAGSQISAPQFIAYLEKEPITRQSAILTEKLAALYAMQGKPELAVKSLQAALALQPTPQQAVRLTFTLGDELLVSKQETEALKLYDEFLAKNPTYPEALTLYRKLEPLAAKLGKEADAARYASEIKRLLPPK